MEEPIRISAEEARKMVTAGDALLVCAYDDDNRFNSIRLEGAIPLSGFKAKLLSIPKDRRIIFY